MFKVTPYHFAAFSIGSELFIKGRLTQFNGYLQLSQPKKITLPNRIVPKYKTSLKNSQMIEVLKAYITYESLIREGLTSREADHILALHFPNSLNELFAQKTLKKEILETLKTVEAYNHFKKLQSKRVDFPPSA
ncbi:MAG: ATP-dependent DNA helicase RecG, partial [Campylobacterales bacterium]|nr:ATP-dependent DNA helicase RecG [Campylobacterales bacterium]